MYLFVIQPYQTDGYFKSRFQRIPCEVYKIVYYLHMDFYSALHYEYLLEENNERNQY